MQEDGKNYTFVNQTYPEFSNQEGEIVEVQQTYTEEEPTRRHRRLTGEAYVAIVQFAICLAVVLALLLFRMVGGEYYDNFYRAYQDLLHQKIEISEFSDEDSGSGDASQGSGTTSAQSIVTGQISQPLLAGAITCGFGQRMDPFSGEQAEHQGMDIAAAKNSPIYCLLNGTVKDAGWDDVYGNYILVDHGAGIQSFYAHCEELLVHTGQGIKTGQEIARVGMSGAATGYHLHLELRINGQKVNPCYYFPSNQYDTV